jgi:hypothetical protein
LAFTINRGASVLDEGKGNFLKWHQLWTHPIFSTTCNTCYANKLGRLCQGIGTSPNSGKHVKGTKTLFPILYKKSNSSTTGKSPTPRLFARSNLRRKTTLTEHASPLMTTT